MSFTNITGFFKGISAAIAALFSVLGILTLPANLNLDSIKHDSTVIDTEYTEHRGTADRIHFLPVGSGNCVILESNGKFAMLDAAEDNDNPRGLSGLEISGYEDYIIAYLKEHCADENGKVTIEWFLGSHAHSDHIGGFNEIAQDADITFKTAYLKKYDHSRCFFYERLKWDNQEVYDQMIEACEANSVELIQDIPSEAFSFEDFTVQFFNTEVDTIHYENEENSNSIVALITKGDSSTLITGDLDWLNGDEKAVADAVGHVDLLEIGHHGNIGSSAPDFVNALSPETAIACNTEENLKFSSVIKTYSAINCPIYTTVENDGIIATFADSGTYAGKIVLDCDTICSQQLN